MKRQTVYAEIVHRSRKGKANYSNTDVDMLLDIVNDIIPLGSNIWALVEKECNLWSTQNSRPKRDQDRSKRKFEKLANMKKNTHDPLCSSKLRRAKRISKKILCECSAMSVGDDDAQAVENVLIDENESAQHNLSVSNRQNRITKQSFALKPRKIEKDTILRCMQDVTDSMVKIPSTLTLQDIHKDIQKLDSREVKKATKETQKSIHELKEFIKGIIN